MSSLDANSTLTDVAFVVCTALERAREHAVLCGGSAATFYVPEKYESRDLDFVLHFGALTTVVDAALAPLGYIRAPEKLYRHPVARFTVEFPPGPLAIGSETVTKHATERRGDLVLHVYSPTDVVRDRFMHFWAWGDERALRVALDVAAACCPAIDVASIEAWTERELRAAPVYDRSRRDRFLVELESAVTRPRPA
jgi:hypothetical protein